MFYVEKQQLNTMLIVLYSNSRYLDKKRGVVTKDKFVNLPRHFQRSQIY